MHHTLMGYGNPQWRASNCTYIRRVLGNVRLTFEELATHMQYSHKSRLASAPSSWRRNWNVDTWLLPYRKGYWSIITRSSNYVSLYLRFSLAGTCVRHSFVISLWQRWSADYLDSFKRTSKWHNYSTNLRVGDIVILLGKTTWFQQSGPLLKWRKHTRKRSTGTCRYCKNFYRHVSKTCHDVTKVVSNPLSNWLLTFSSFTLCSFYHNTSHVCTIHYHVVILKILSLVGGMLMMLIDGHCSHSPPTDFLWFAHAQLRQFWGKIGYMRTASCS